ncbi:hypothetical protein Sjap_025757 [Stephania japonica]|uniref:Uncharacterized protein n=1 Tax=Stephania japonica TaxID=461633 RepID=A0AAP0E2C3_9MAGN
MIKEMIKMQVASLEGERPHLTSDDIARKVVDVEIALTESSASAAICWWHQLLVDSMNQKVLGTGLGYYRGLGYGPHPPSKCRFAQDNETIVSMQQELEEHRGHLKEA